MPFQLPQLFDFSIDKETQNVSLVKTPFTNELYQNKLEAYEGHTLFHGESDPFYFLNTSFLYNENTPEKRAKRFPATMAPKRKTNYSSNMNKRVKTLEKRVMQNKTELKFATGILQPSQLLGPTIDLTSAITEGTKQGQRVGDTVMVKAIEVYGQGVKEGERIRVTLFSPENTGTGIPVTDSEPYNRFHDTTLVRVWADYRDLSELTAIAEQAGPNPTSGRQPRLRKVFTYPMKVTWREGFSIPNHNAIELWHKKESFTGAGTTDPIGTDNTQITLAWKIWYYDS